MKNSIKQLQQTNQFSTGDLQLIQELQSEGRIKTIRLWIKAKSIPLLNSGYGMAIILGHRLLSISNTIT